LGTATDYWQIIVNDGKHRGNIHIQFELPPASWRLEMMILMQTELPPSEVPASQERAKGFLLVFPDLLEVGT